jgi:hypothetical protein
MRLILFLLAIVAFLAGFGILAAAKSAVHEIEGFALYIVAAVLFSGAAIVDALINLPKRLVQAQEAEAKKVAAPASQS